MCMLATTIEGVWQSWGQWKQSAPGVRARIRMKDTRDQCPHKYQGTIKCSLLWFVVSEWKTYQTKSNQTSKNWTEHYKF